TSRAAPCSRLVMLRPHYVLRLPRQLHLSSPIHPEATPRVIGPRSNWLLPQVRAPVLRGLLLAALGVQDVGEVVVRITVVRIQFERLLEGFYGLVRFAQFCQDITQVIPGINKVLIEFKRLAKALCCLGLVAQGVEDIGQVERRPFLWSANEQRLAVGAGGLAQLAGIFVAAAALEPLLGAP